MDVALVTNQCSFMLASLTIQPSIVDKIKEGQANDANLQKVRVEVIKGEKPEFNLAGDGTLRFGTRLCVPNLEEIRKEILVEAHCTPYSVHPGSTKMYRDVSKTFWWAGMKRDIAKFVEQCLICQQVKIEHQRPSGLLKLLVIPKWKWERISMDLGNSRSVNEIGSFSTHTAGSFVGKVSRIVRE